MKIEVRESLTFGKEKKKVDYLFHKKGSAKRVEEITLLLSKGISEETLKRVTETFARRIGASFEEVFKKSKELLNK